MDTRGVLLFRLDQRPECYQHQQTPLVLATDEVVLQDLEGRAEARQVRARRAEPSSEFSLPLPLPTAT